MKGEFKNAVVLGAGIALGFFLTNSVLSMLSRRVSVSV